MASHILKIWHCTLKDEYSVESPAFRQLISTLLEFCSSYTNPTPGTPPMHAWYLDREAPTRLYMITGYQSQELNTEADQVYASKYLPSMFECVQHQWLRQLDLDVTTLPLDHDIEMVYGTCPSQWRSKEAVATGTFGRKPSRVARFQMANTIFVPRRATRKFGFNSRAGVKTLPARLSLLREKGCI